MKKLQVLVIEDNERHTNDAKKYLNEKSCAVIDYAKNLLDALRMMGAKKYDGIISDIFFPIAEIITKEDCMNSYKLRGKLINLIHATIFRKYIAATSEYEKSMDEWVSKETLPPSGFYLINIAIEKKIAIAVTTDSRHHGLECQPITAFIKDLHISLFSTDGSDREKDWNSAFNFIVSDNRNKKDRSISYNSIKKNERRKRNENK